MILTAIAVIVFAFAAGALFGVWYLESLLFPVDAEGEE